MKATDDSKTFSDLLKDDKRIENNEINTLNINIFNDSLINIINPECFNSK